MRTRVAEILWGRRAFGALVLTLLALRSVAFVIGLVNLDECDFWLFGRMVRQHAVPYLDVADIKPPLTYAAFWVADLVGGHRPVAMPCLGLLAVLATALVLRAVARRWSGDERVGWAAAWLTLAACLCESPSASAEILMNLPAAGALYALVRAERDPRRRWDLAAGAAAGIATLFKLQAGILLVCFVLAAVSSARRRKEGIGPALVRATCITAGYAAPWALTVGLFAAGGALPGFLEWVIQRNLFQISSGSPFALRDVLTSMALALGGASFAWWLALRQVRRRGDGFQFALTILLVLTVLPVSIGRRFYEHYFLQFVPPLALLGAPQLVWLVIHFRALSRLRRAAVLVLAFAAPVIFLAFTWTRGFVGGYPGQEPRARAIAGWLRAHTAPSERMFVWGDYSALYCLADRLPGTRYMRTAPHVGDFDPMHVPADFDFRPYRSERDVAATLADLERNRPEMVVDTAPADLHRWSLFPLARVPELQSFIAAHYQPVSRPAGAVIYRRRDLVPPAGALVEAAPDGPSVR